MVNRRLFVTALTVAVIVVTLAFAASAMASTEGQVTLSAGDAAVSLDSGPGGGSWHYGSEVFPAISMKHCWSHYNHQEKTHSATAVVGPTVIKVKKAAKVWANADAYDSWRYSAQAYWNTY